MKPGTCHVKTFEWNYKRKLSSLAYDAGLLAGSSVDFCRYSTVSRKIPEGLFGYKVCITSKIP